jgi:hypothetical protein
LRTGRRAARIRVACIAAIRGDCTDYADYADWLDRTITPIASIGETHRCALHPFT